MKLTLQIKFRLLILALLLGQSLQMFANDVKFSATAPNTVIVDKPFQLVYTVNSAAKDLRVGDISNFEILAGPFESRSSSYQIINGKTSSSISLTYTYTLQATKTGTFTIPSATIIVDGQKYTSNGLTIKVLPADDKNASAGSQSQSQKQSTGNANISNDRIFIRTSVSKTSVYEQEPILVTYKLYTLVDVVGMNNMKLPDFNGFMKQEFDQDQNKQLSYENFNGKNYGTVLLYQVLLYPQRSGDIIIDKANFEAIVRIQNQTQIRSIFDDFFDSYSNINKSLVAPGSKITVKALPGARPSTFSGTVGKLSMTASISSQNVTANEAVTLKIVISGNGNMKMIKNPEIKFPDAFETYDPKVVNNFKTSGSGLSGTKIIEYMFIPRHSGEYEIPSAEFSYFDINDKTYKTLRTPEYRIKVAKGEGGENTVVSSNYVSKEDVKQLGKDIRYIETENFRIKSEEKTLFGSLISWLLFVIPLIISTILFYVLKKQTINNSDLVSVKNRRANKLARKRLSAAQRLLSEGKKDKFYEEVLKAVWTYLSDKLAIPAAALTRETVEAELGKRDVSAELKHAFISILDSCEFARYAPNSGQQEMGNLYNETIEAISKLENQIKK
ncbi:MAG: protein BatD [Paludibacteraceae bacterium]|nr:protein BatD [Paludibacteraceae bacterium]